MSKEENLERVKQFLARNEGYHTYQTVEKVLGAMEEQGKVDRKYVPEGGPYFGLGENQFGKGV